MRDTLRFFEVDKPTFIYKLKDAIRDGWLAPYQIYKAKTVKTAAEGGFEVKRDELDWTAMDAETKAELEKVFGTDEALRSTLRPSNDASPSPSATGPLCGSSATCTTTAIGTGRACCESR